MTVRVNSGDDDVGISYLTRFNVEDGYAIFPRMPFLVFDPDLIVDQCHCLTDRWAVDVCIITNCVGEISACLKIHGATNAPNCRKHHPLLHEAINLALFEREILTFLIKDENILDTLAQECKEALKHTHLCELHNVS